MKREKMNVFLRVNRSSMRIMLVLIGLFQLNFMLCWSLNDEGIALLKFRDRVVDDPFGALSSWNEDIGETDHCSWFGIECVDGHVVSLNLKNLGLEGTLAPELHNLLHIKSIILRNNSFRGSIPGEICELKELELLDLGYNNLSGPFPVEFGYSSPILLIDNNELAKTMILSEVQVEENHLMGTTRRKGQPKNRPVHPRMLKVKLKKRVENFFSPSESQQSGNDGDSGLQPPHSASDHNPRLQPPHKEPQNSPPPLSNNPFQTPLEPPLTPSSTSDTVPPPPPSFHAPSLSSASKANVIPIVIGTVGGFVGLILVIIAIFLWRSNKITTVARPWATGLSAQLQKAFVTGNVRSDGLHSDKPTYVEGIPNLKRSELETACEDFSNVIGSSSIGTIYKGTLSNGREIAVISLAVVSPKDWSRNLETQFRKKIETLSKVNHTNFVNLIGYCEEEIPFTRLMVFEYAPNGSLFEHLHVREAEHLDWGMRLRIAMGMAYCLEHMHQLVPPLTHLNLNSSAVNLSEDYAAKISDFCFWNEVAPAQVQPIGMPNLSPSSASPETNVHSFGLVLLEMMTGRIPLSVENSSLENWVSEYLRGEQLLQELVDPMLRHFDLEQLERISEVITKCLLPDPQQRPTMRDIAARFREITGINKDKATPRLTPLWWEELEVRSANGG